MKKQLHSGVKWLWRVGYIWSVVFIAVFLSFMFVPLMLANQAMFNFGWFLIPFIGFVILFLALAELWVHLSYNRWFYEFTDDNLKIENGVIWKNYKNIPYERVQNVDIRRGIIARILGFSTVMIQTAGYSGPYARHGYGAEGSIPAVDMNEAEKIRDFVIKKISRKKSKSGL